MLMAHTTMAASLAFENIHHSYGQTVALDGVSFNAAPGEIVCLLGASGCGKSTLLRIAAGLEHPISGRVLLADREVTGKKRFVPPEERGVGLMFQDYALFPHLTILQNVMFGLGKLQKTKARETALRALQRVNLSDHAFDYPHMLSGGEQQRTALARALAPNPAVILMDEPFSNLDQRLRDHVREETLSLLREKRATAIIVTHDPVEAMQMADRIVLMRQGKIVQTGTSNELYNHPVSLFAARFFSELNELPATVDRGIAMCALGEFSVPLSFSGKAILALRPQHLMLCDCGEALVEGIVVGERFLGATRQYSVKLEGHDRLLIVSTSACHSTATIGRTIGLKVSENRWMLFPAQA